MTREEFVDSILNKPISSTETLQLIRIIQEQQIEIQEYKKELARFEGYV